GLALVLTGDDQRVKEIEPDRGHLHHDFARRGHRLGDVRQHEVVWGTVTGAEDGFHGEPAAVGCPSMDQRATCIQVKRRYITGVEANRQIEGCRPRQVTACTLPTSLGYSLPGGGG